MNRGNSSAFIPQPMPPDDSPACLKTTGSDIFVHCGLRAPEEEVICNKTHAHLLVMPEDLCEAEICWRTRDGAAKTLWLEGRRVIFVPKNIPYEICWKKTAAFVRMALTDAFVADAATQKHLVSVQIRHEWQLASVDFLVHLLFDRFAAQCRRITFPGTNSYIDSVCRVYAVHALKILDARETGQSSGLAIPSLKRVQAYIEKNLGEEIYVSDLAREAGLGLHQFGRLFKVSTGMTPVRYVSTIRIQRAQQLRYGKKMSGADVAAATGFCDESYLWHSLQSFFKGGKRNAGKLPAKHRKTQSAAKKIGQTGATFCPHSRTRKAGDAGRSKRKNP